MWTTETRCPVSGVTTEVEGARADTRMAPTVGAEAASSDLDTQEGGEMDEAGEECPRCGEQERLGTWCGACGALLEDLEPADAAGMHGSRWRVAALVVLVLLVVAVVVAGFTGLPEPLDVDPWFAGSLTSPPG